MASAGPSRGLALDIITSTRRLIEIKVPDPTKVICVIPLEEPTIFKLDYFLSQLSAATVVGASWVI